MTHTSELYQKAIPIIDEVLELSPEQQDEAIAKACGVDSELERYLRGLLSHRKDLLATDEGVDVFKILRVSQIEEADPETFGPYRVLRRLGAGGMSIVYLAKQPNPQRLVALKVLHAAVSPAVLQREAETLARLRHPGIAHVYEAGTALTAAGSKPYFVMEFVRAANGQGSTAGDGQAQDAVDPSVSEDVDAHARTMTLRDYVRSKGALPFGRVLELVAEACDAVAYAHSQGVLHRDLKPLNVLVDHLEHPKIIDFGIAKLIGRAGPASAAAVDAAIIGTPLYMSPELLSGESAPDVRGDVYALGMIAYELLGNAIPFDMLTGEKSSDLQTLCRASPVPLSSRVKSIPRDMEAIVMKAIARDPTQRYDGATSLAKDIRNCLEKRPVSARPNTLVYRGTCLMRRRPYVTAGSIIAAVLIGAAGVQAYRENAGARDALGLLVTGMEQVDPLSSDGKPATLGRMLDGIAGQLDRRTSLHPAAAAQLHLLLGSLYFRLDQRNDVGATKALRHYQSAVDIFESRYGRGDERTLSAKNDFGMALSKSGDAEQAVRIFEEILPMRDRSENKRGANVTRGNYAVALLRLKRIGEASKQFQTVYDQCESQGQRYEALTARVWQTRLLMELDRLSEAEPMLRDAVKEAEEARRSEPLFNDIWVASMIGLTLNLMGQEKWSLAQPELLRLHDWMVLNTMPDNRLHRTVLERLMEVQVKLGDMKGALESQRRIKAWDTAYGDGGG